MIAERLDKREFLIGELEILAWKQTLPAAASTGSRQTPAVGAWLIASAPLITI
jgi:hypothetical protein